MDEDEARELEREVRRGRAFSTEEAIGRMLGSGAMKGASPIDRRRQAAAAIDEAVRRLLRDHGGALGTLIAREAGDSRELLEHLDRPLDGLRAWLAGVLSAPARLEDLVREADAAWGAMMDERPRFDRPGEAPAPDDPYTADSVRAALSALREALATVSP
jgi:hypothetical protein